MHHISFPGLGIKEFVLNPVIFEIPIFGGLQIRWYAVIITLGMIIAFTYASLRAKQVGIKFDDMLDFVIYTVLFGIIGARLYYVIFEHDNIKSFLDVISIWKGGLAIYGGLIAGGLTVFIICLIKKIKFFKLADCTVPGVMIAQALGRWGNFFNGEAYGGVIPEGSPLYFIRMGISPNNIPNVSGMAFVHPTFLYESLWNILGFILINIFYKKKKFDGQIFFTYIAWYGLGRMFIEGLRTDSLFIGPGEVIRVSQVVAFICFVTGVIAIIIGLVKARRAALTARDYDPAYPKFATTASMGAEDLADAECEDTATAESDDKACEQTDSNTDTDKGEDKNGEDN